MTVLMTTYLFFFLTIFSLLMQLGQGTSLLLGGGILFLIAFQTFMNLGVVSGLLPPTGLNLPFFSQGGSSLIANAFGVGLLYDMGRKVRMKKILMATGGTGGHIFPALSLAFELLEKRKDLQITFSRTWFGGQPLFSPPTIYSPFDCFRPFKFEKPSHLIGGSGSFGVWFFKKP